MEKENVIKEKSFAFALQIIEFADLLEEHKKYIIGEQILKSGTSIGANIREAQSAESRADFIHKMKIALKEAEETDYWLLLCKFSQKYPFDENLIINLNEIKKILNSIIHSSIKTRNSNKP
jgi:four helix bundle protein